MAADSQTSDVPEVGLYSQCQKVFRKRVSSPGGRRKYDILIGTAGEDFSGVLFTDWYPGADWILEGKDLPKLPHAFEYDPEYNDFLCITLEPSGVYLVDYHLRPIKQIGKFFAVGSGAPLAMALMESGASPKRAVELACKYDLYSRPPVITEHL